MYTITFLWSSKLHTVDWGCFSQEILQILYKLRSTIFSLFTFEKQTFIDGGLAKESITISKNGVWLHKFTWCGDSSNK